MPLSKGSLSSVEAGNIIRDEILKLNPDYDIEVVPVADGGEGTIDALRSLDGAELITTGVTGPLGENLDADFLYIKEQNLALIEMSKAAGLTLIKNKAQPLKATTLGDAFFPIIDQLRPIDEAMDKIIAEANLRRTVNQTFRLISLYNQN